jgi:hypothetical protein
VTLLDEDTAVSDSDGAATSDGGVTWHHAGGGVGPCGQARDGRSEGGSTRGGCVGRAVCVPSGGLRDAMLRFAPRMPQELPGDLYGVGASSSHQPGDDGLPGDWCTGLE